MSDANNRNESTFEQLESRRLMSYGHSVASLQFDQTPTDVQNGLTTLASADSLTPDATQKVRLGNSNGVETYSISFDNNGTFERFTVDQTGAAVTKPTKTTDTWDNFSTAQTAAADEINAIATALNLTVPASDTTVTEITKNGTTTFSVALTPADSTSDHPRHTIITVDANGNPVGNQRVPFSTLPTAVQDGLTANTPSGADPLTADSLIRVSTVDGVTLYSASFNSTGSFTRIFVNSNGDLTSPSTHTTTTFGDLGTSDANAATALQTLATEKGGDTIDPAANVNVLTEANGTTLYSVRTSVTTTDSEGNTHTHSITLTVDADGNPTVLPNDGFGGYGNPFAYGGLFGGGGGFFGFGRHGFRR